MKAARRVRLCFPLPATPTTIADPCLNILAIPTQQESTLRELPAIEDTVHVAYQGPVGVRTGVIIYRTSGRDGEGKVEKKVEEITKNEK